MPKIKNIFCVLISAGAGVAAFPSVGLWPLAWLGLVPLFFAVSNTTPGRAFFLGWLYGAVYAMGIGYWVFHALYYNSSAGLITSLIFMILVIGGAIGWYFAVFSFMAAWILRFQLSSMTKVMAISCLWVGMEFCRAHLFSGIPWALIGYSQYPWLRLIQISDITGVYGLSFLIVLSNSAVFLTMQNFSHRWKLLFLPVFLIIAALIYGSICLSRFSPEAGSHPRISANTPSIAVIQISVSQKDKWDKSKWPGILDNLLKLSESALKEGADLIVWPETTVPFYLKQQIPASLTYLLEQYQATLLTGGPRYTGSSGNYTFYNAAYQVGSGRILKVYNKMHLLPFGEYFPLNFIDVLKLRYSAPRQYSLGRETVIFNSRPGRFGVLICFEVLFPELTRQIVGKKSDFIVNISNDAWFGRTSEHSQHFSMAVFRAVECRRPLIRSSNTGISGFIDAAGHIISRIPAFEQGYLLYHPTILKNISFYCRYGDLFAWLCIFFLFVRFFFQCIRYVKTC